MSIKFGQIDTKSFDSGDDNDWRRNRMALKTVQVLFVNSGLLRHFLLFSLIHAVPDPIHHGDPWIFLQAFAVPGEKVPVQAVEGAGHIAVTLLPFVFACFTVITHGMNVFG